MAIELVEPTGKVADESQIPTGTAAAASEQAQQPSQTSAADDLKAAMSKLSPARPEPSSAQRLSAETAPAPEAQKEGEKPAEPAAERTTESALDSFRTGLHTSRRQKQKTGKTTPDAEVSQTEQKEETPAAAEPTKEGSEKSKEASTPAQEDTPVTDEEIQKTIDDPAISKRHQKRMIHLANKAKELEAKLAAAEAKPATSANDDKVKQLEQMAEEAQKELVRYRRRYSLESEPELKKFDEIAVKAEESIYGKLKENGLSDATVKLIKEMGGFDGFSRSAQAFTINVKDEDGDIVQQKVSAAELAKKWLNDMPLSDSEYVRAKMGERYNAFDGKKRKAEELSADAENWFKQQQQQQEQAMRQQQESVRKNQDEYQKWTEEFSTKQEWMKDRAIPVTATPEERAEIEEWNKGNQAVKVLLKAAANPTTVADYTALVEEAATSQRFRRENSKLAKENAALKEQMNRLRSGTSTTGKPGGGSLSRAPAKKEDTSAATQLSTSAADSLKAAFERMQGGGNDD